MRARCFYSNPPQRTLSPRNITRTHEHTQPNNGAGGGDTLPPLSKAGADSVDVKSEPLESASGYRSPGSSYRSPASRGGHSGVGHPHQLANGAGTSSTQGSDEYALQRCHTPDSGGGGGSPNRGTPPHSLTSYDAGGAGGASGSHDVRMPLSEHWISTGGSSSIHSIGSPGGSPGGPGGAAATWEEGGNPLERDSGSLVAHRRRRPGDDGRRPSSQDS